MSILAYNIHVTYNGIASALGSASVGGLITNIVCGIFQNFVKNYQDLLLTMAFFLRAIRTIEQTIFSCHINNIFVYL